MRKTFQSDDQRYIGVRQPGWTAILDRRLERIIMSADFGDPVPLTHEMAKPLQQLLGAYYDRDMPFMHVRMGASGGREVPLGGAGGAGKSTSAIACSLAGFDFPGDDRIGLQQVDDGFVGHRVFSSVMGFEQHMRRFPGLARRAIHLRAAGDRKSVVFPTRPGMRRGCAKVHTGKNRIAAAPRVEGRRSAGHRSELPDPAHGPGRRGMRRVAEILGTVPCFQLDIGENSETIPAWIEQTLD